ncbi:hypothetical protein B9T33_01605 [Acinetobacter sp. ANC 5054]|uniref:DUF805 domain-containing protein n=1 Tax=Acinetobacter sp. ANC 5054 TaxID=1977877 RepID=UPI000A33928D|nr:DUF805 domain-containing protein [Acinetobacter sp. ANC 5054]OTG84504.1 hypothetical protein B9T33_01605 [Acinetobacter sp. ANC 5054]
MNTNNSSSFFSRNPTPVVDNPLTPDGRFGRLSMIGWYGFLNIIACLALIGLSLAVGIFNFNTLALNDQFIGILTGFSGLAYLAIVVLYIYFYCVFVVRRLHDLNKAGWWMLWLLFPIINLFFIVYLLLASGDPNNNRYGAPRPAAVWEKILAWLMILLSLLSIFATGSITSYMMGTGELETPTEILQQSTDYF